MKKLFVSLFCTALCLFCSAQIKQPGIVREYNFDKRQTPLPGVEIIASNSSSQVSDKNGRFVLEFLQLQPGQHINVKKVYKPGYEVFNVDAVNQWNLSDNQTAFILVLVRSSKFAELKDDYYGCLVECYKKEMSKIRGELDSQLKENRIVKSEYEASICDLQNQYESYIATLEKYVDKFARLDLNALSKVDREVVELVRNGELYKAIRKYEEQHFVEQYVKEAGYKREMEETVRVKTENMSSLFSSVIKQVNLYMMAGGKEQYDKALSTLGDVADSDTTALAPVMAYAELLYDQGRFPEAIIYSSMYGRLASRNGIDSLVAKSYWKQSQAYNRLKEFERSIGCVDKAISIYSGMDSCDLDVRRNLASCYNTKGNALCSATLYKDAEQPLLAAYTLRTAIYDQTHESADADRVNMVLSNLVNLTSKNKDFDNAGKYADRMLEYARISHPEGTELYLEQMSASYHVRTIVSSDKYQIDSLLENAKNALFYQRQLYKRNPDRYAGDYSSCLNNLADAYRRASLPDSALVYGEKALSIRKEQVLLKPSDGTKSVYANTLIMMGSIYRWNEDFEKAEAYFTESREIFSELFASDSLHYLFHMQMSDDRLASLYEKMKNYEKALPLRQISLDRAYALAQYDPEAYTELLYDARLDLSDLYFQMHRFEECECIIEDNIRSLEELYEQNSQAYSSVMTLYYLSAFRCYRILQNNSMALKYIDKLLIMKPGNARLQGLKQNVIEDMKTDGIVQ